jgi:transposase
MVTIGVDSHKRTHTAVAVDGNGRKLAEKTVATTADGHLALIRWARRRRERTWALEDCRQLTRRLEADLLRAGERVMRVPPRLTAGTRTANREPGKSDPIDALSVARAALREPNLPQARLDGNEREVRLLVDHRAILIADRTRHQSRLRWFLVELGVAEPEPRALARVAVLASLERELASRPEMSARVGRDLLARIRELTVAINGLGREIEGRTKVLAPSLLALAGCGYLTAAKIIGETGGVARFRSRAAFANHTGTAPIPVWSGNTVRHRLNRGGNRQLNLALHRIAITQLHCAGSGRDYAAKRMAAGDTRLEAIRALKRRIADEVFRRLTADEADWATLNSAARAAA